MPAKKSSKAQLTKKTTASQALPWPMGRKAKIIVGLIVLILLLLIARNVKDSITAARDKEQLDKVDKQMMIVRDSIIAEVGPPHYKENSKSCSYPNLKFEKGQLACGPHSSLVYGISTKQEGVQLANSIQKAIDKSSVTKIKSTLQWGYVDSNEGMSIHMFPQDILQVRCSMHADIDSTGHFQPDRFSKNLNTPLQLTLGFSCSKPVNREMYKVDS